MTTDDEMLIAEIIADVSVWGIGRDLGRPVSHDDGSQPGMFDILFPDSDPPAAMEVTQIVDSHFVQTASEAMKAVERRLTQEAVDSGHSVSWTFHIVAGASLKDLDLVMRELIRCGRAPTGRDIAPGLNKVDALPSDKPEVNIATWLSTRAVALRGFGSELEQAIADNRAKLAAAVGYERHLAVDIIGLRASDPGATYIPDLPDEIDWIWVTRRAYSSIRARPVVWVTDGIKQWKANGEPHEAM